MSTSNLQSRINQTLRIILAVLLIGLGLVITPLPIPVGLLLIALGIIILAYNNNRVTRLLRILRRRFPKLSRALLRLEQRNIIFISRVLRSTNPAEKMPPRQATEKE